MPDPAYHPLVRAVAAALRRRCGVGPRLRLPTHGLHLLVGESGGADTGALLRALHHLAQRRGWHLRLSVAHVNHHLRGDAEEDARFVQRLAESLGLTCATRDIEPACVCEQEGGNLEAVARRMRYVQLDAMCRASTPACTHVAVAHHADDQLETVLMRLLRGTGLRGLSGMAWHRPLSEASDTADAVRLIRPMLAVTRQQVTDYLAQLEQPWRHDATNDDHGRTRARLRHEVLPLLRAMHPDVAQRVGVTARHAREAYRTLARQQSSADACWQTQEDGHTRWATRAALRDQTRGALCLSLRRVAHACGVESDRLGMRKLTPIVRACHDGRGGRRVFELGDGVELIVTRERVTVGRQSLSEASPSAASSASSALR